LCKIFAIYYNLPKTQIEHLELYLK
jgi:hypothetical protein